MIGVEDISVRFGDAHALTGASLTLEPEQSCGATGPNGAGMTTLLDVVTGIRRPGVPVVRVACLGQAVMGARH